jgi:hypothetical protein
MKYLSRAGMQVEECFQSKKEALLKFQQGNNIFTNLC